jgi:hypothetical protein
MALAGENTALSLANLFQEVYAKEVKYPIPDGAMLVKELPFKGVETTTGGKFIQPVILTRENGFTYQAGDSDSAFALRNASAHVSKRAELVGSNLVGRGRLGYEAAARAASGKAAFVEATELLVENLTESAAFRLELMFLYGQSGIGTVDSSPSTTVLPVTAATWAPAIWAGLEGCAIMVITSDLATVKGTANISSVEMDETSANYRKVTLAAAITLPVAGDLIFFAGAVEAGGTYHECVGLDKIITTSSGNLFGISVTSYPLWRGNTYTVSGALTLTKIMGGVKRAVSKGLKGECRLLVSPKAWFDLVNPTMDAVASAGARKIDQSYGAKKVEFGTEAIKIYGPQGRNVEIVAHPYVKEGEAFLVPMKSLRRVGAQDIDFKTPGMKSEDMFIHLQDNAGYEFRCYANQALFCDSPAHCVKFTSIT